MDDEKGALTFQEWTEEEAPKKKWSEKKEENHQSEPGVMAATHMTQLHS